MQIKYTISTGMTDVYAPCREPGRLSPCIIIRYADCYFELNGPDDDANDEYRMEAMMMHARHVISIDEKHFAMLQYDDREIHIIEHRYCE